MLRKLFIRLILSALVLSLVYGGGRLYFQLTGGFTEKNISSDFGYNPKWETRTLTETEAKELEAAISQPYHYLSKGCQSYVFLSADGRYVIKFFKYQRFRLQPWLTYFPSLPAISKFRQEKIEKKQSKLEGFFKSWQIAFEDLKPETGLLFVHLNKTDLLHRQLTLFDKLGGSHSLDLDQTEFCIQRRAEMLCPTLLSFKEKNDLMAAQALIADLLQLILSEYERGLADNDHALMQNTGIAEGRPVHVDVGQFVRNERIKDPQLYHQELFTKTYKFKLWLKEAYPELALFLEEKLQEIIGDSYRTMQPKFREK